MARVHRLPAVPDFQINDCGSIAMIRPCTDSAREWVTKNLSLESWQWQGDAFAVEPRCVSALVEGMRDDGLDVEF